MVLHMTLPVTSRDQILSVNITLHVDKDKAREIGEKQQTF